MNLSKSLKYIRLEVIWKQSIFLPYAEKDVTSIRESDRNPVYEVYDANALYLWAPKQDMAIEQPVRRKKEKFGKSRIKVDRLNEKSLTEYQYHGCQFHGHSYWLTRGKTYHPYNEKNFHRAERKEPRDYWLSTKTIVNVRIYLKNKNMSASKKNSVAFI